MFLSVFVICVKENNYNGTCVLFLFEVQLKLFIDEISVNDLLFVQYYLLWEFIRYPAHEYFKHILVMCMYCKNVYCLMILVLCALHC